jgi:hypothetical protein
MTREKILNATASLKVKYARCIYLGLGISLATAIMQTTTVIFINPAFAADSVLDVSPRQKMNSTSATDNILDISPLQKLSNKADASDSPFGVALSSKMIAKEDKEFINLKSHQPSNSPQLSELLKQILPVLLATL